MKNSIYFMATLIFFFLLSGIHCQKQETQEKIVPMESERTITTAVAVLHPTDGSEVHGTVTFILVADGIKIVADVEGLTPGKHGFHIHEYGDCSALDAKSAGGHFNPENMPHGAPNDMERHVGDLGNLEADAEGKAHYERIDKHISFSGSHSIIGLAVIVHDGEDDFVSQPTGNAGARVACGTIGAANPQK